MTKKAKCILPALFGTFFFPFMICDTEHTFSNSLFSVVLFLVLLAFFGKYTCVKTDVRTNIIGYTAGVIFSLLTAFGFSMSKNGFIDYSNFFLWCAVIVYAVVFGAALIWFWKWLERFEKKITYSDEKIKPKGLNSFVSYIFEWPICLAAILLICWLPCYLASFPGNFVYDATAEFNQLTEGYNGDFPMLHTVLITRLLSLGFELTGSYNFGIAVFTVCQMVLLAILFTHILRTFYKMGGNRIVLGILSVYFALFPVIHLLVTCTVRDVLFSGLLTYCIFQIYRLCVNPKEMLESWWRPVIFAATLILTIYSRNNNTGIFLDIALALICILIIVIGKKQYLKATITFTVSAWVFYLALGTALSFMCKPMTESKDRSSMTVFTQSIIRAYELEGDAWTKEEKQAMNRFFNMEKVTYVPESGGATKSYLKISTEQDKKDFLLLWAKIGARYPEHYADAFLANTIGMWFPGEIIDGYNEMGKYQSYDKCYFYFTGKINEPGEHAGLLPNITKWYKDLSLMISFEKIPVVSLMFSIATHFWLLLCCLFYNIYRKNKRLYFPIIIMLCYMIISSFTPLVLLRYYGTVFFFFPIVVMFLLQPQLSVKKEEQELM